MAQWCGLTVRGCLLRVLLSAGAQADRQRGLRRSLGGLLLVFDWAGLLLVPVLLRDVADCDMLLRKQEPPRPGCGAASWRHGGIVRRAQQALAAVMKCSEIGVNREMTTIGS